MQEIAVSKSETRIALISSKLVIKFSFRWI